ncbi:MAG: helix-turn-helix domain-containing protein [Desulfoferrobacter sp.]
MSCPANPIGKMVVNGSFVATSFTSNAALEPTAVLCYSVDHSSWPFPKSKRRATVPFVYRGTAYQRENRLVQPPPPTAKNLLFSCSWPGNVRELLNTLRRAAIWSDGTTISAEDVGDALMPVAKGTTTDILGYPVEDGMNLQQLMAQVARHYLSQALEKTHGNKTKTAELLALPNYQTLTNWLTKYNVKG